MISAVVLTKNEEEHIVDCIESLSFCDEIIVVDDYSEDRTIEVVKNFQTDKPIRVFKRKLDRDFAAQRNFGLEKAKGEWVLFVDADERVSSSLRDEIKSEIRNPKSEITGYVIKRRDFMWGRELRYGETGNMRLLRLARKDAGPPASQARALRAGRWEGRVHEVWRVRGNTGELQHPLLHYPHPTLVEFLEEINRYTDIRAKELFMQGIQVYWPSIVLYPLMKFMLNYFIKRGFLDGLPGVIFAMMMSFHSFLVRGKLWMLWQFRREVR